MTTQDSLALSIKVDPPDRSVRVTPQLKLVRVEEFAFGDERAHEGDDPGAMGDEEDVLKASSVEVSELADDTNLPPSIDPVDEAKQ